MAVNLTLEKKRKEAANAVLSGNNEKGLSFLDEVLAEEPHDVDALLQRAHVFWLQGNLDKALLDYKKAVKYDPLNTIAQKKIAILKSLSEKSKSVNRIRGTVIPINSLIEEPGKAKAVRLTNIGKHDEIAHLAVGEQLSIKVRKHKIELRDINDIFVGNLPDDISKRLIEFMKEGAVYEGYVLAIDKSEARVLVREQKKPRKLLDTPSFIVDSIDNNEETLDENDDGIREQRTDEEDQDLDLEDESIVVHGNSDQIEEDEDEKDQDDDTYKEYEE